MSDRRLLILMATETYKAQAFLAAAQAQSVLVTVATNRTQALAHLNPAGNLTIDFGDPASACRDIVAFAERQELSGVVAADDDGVEIAALAASALGLLGNPLAAVRMTRQKRLMRERLAKTGLLLPEFVTAGRHDTAESLRDRVSLPCVVKPVGLAASRGVVRADTLAELREALELVWSIVDRAPGGAGDELLIEAFIPGREFALEGLMSNGQLKVLAIFDKPDPLDGPYFEESIYITPSRLGAKEQAALESTTAAAVEAIGLVEGPIHAELRLNNTGVWLLEAAARSIGGLCSRSLRFDGGISLEELIVRHAVGQDVSGVRRERCASGVMMIPVPVPGRLERVANTEVARAVTGVEDVVISLPPGSEVLPAPRGSRYLGFIFARSDTPGAVEAALRQAHASLDIGILASDGDADTKRRSA